MVCNLLAVRLLRRGPCPLPCIDNRNFRLVPSGVTVHIELDCESGYKPSAVQNYIYGKVHVVDRSSHFSEKSRFQVPLPDHSTACQGHDTMPSAGRVPRAILTGRAASRQTERVGQTPSKGDRSQIVQYLSSISTSASNLPHMSEGRIRWSSCRPNDMSCLLKLCSLLSRRLGNQGICFKMLQDLLEPGAYSVTWHCG